jgi:hypothetical protein
MSETISTLDLNGRTINLPVEDLAHVLGYSGGNLVSDTVQYGSYPQVSPQPVYYTQTLTYAAEGSGIATVTVNTAGEFSVLTLPLVAGTPGSGATFTPTFKLVTPTVAAAGTGYAVADVLTFVGGTQTIAATVVVDTVNGSGGVLTVTPVAVGNYTIFPIGPVSVTGGFGTNATFNPTWGLLAVGVTAPGANYTAASSMTFAGTIVTPPTVTFAFTSDPTVVGLTGVSQWIAHQ